MSQTQDLFNSTNEFISKIDPTFDNVYALFENDVYQKASSPSARFFKSHPPDEKEIPQVSLRNGKKKKIERGYKNHLFKGLKQPAFYTLCDFLDTETIFELRYVCLASKKLILNDDILENLTLKLELKKLKKCIFGVDDSNKDTDDDKRIFFKKRIGIDDQLQKVKVLNLLKRPKPKKKFIVNDEMVNKYREYSRIECLLKEYDISEKYYKSRIFQMVNEFYDNEPHDFFEYNRLQRRPFDFYHYSSMANSSNLTYFDTLTDNSGSSLYRCALLPDDKLYQRNHQRSLSIPNTSEELSYVYRKEYDMISFEKPSLVKLIDKGKYHINRLKQKFDFFTTFKIIEPVMETLSIPRLN